MSRQAKFALFFFAVSVTMCVSGAFAQTSNVRSAKSAPALLLTIKLHPGDGFIEHRYESDRVEWKLPRKRLEPFRRAGVIIEEERHITSVVRANVVSVKNGVALLEGLADISSVDVPRRQITSDQQPFATTLTTRNDTGLSASLSVEDAAMVKLPASPVSLGQHWQTQLAVITTLGSGNVKFDHEVQSIDAGLVKVSVRGHGEITGMEYHLPKLLPGSIELNGEAWYDLQSGLITQESYLIRNRILKPAEGEQIGFDERLTVDISARRI